MIYELRVYEARQKAWSAVKKRTDEAGWLLLKQTVSALDPAAAHVLLS